MIGYEGFAERVRELTGGEGVAVVYDGVGRATFDGSLDALRRRGTLVLYGNASGRRAAGRPVPAAPGRLALPDAPDPARLRRTRARSCCARAGEVLGWVAEGRLEVRDRRRYPLADARQAHEDLEARRTTGKLLLDPSA